MSRVGTVVALILLPSLSLTSGGGGRANLAWGQAPSLPATAEPPSRSAGAVALPTIPVMDGAQGPLVFRLDDARVRERVQELLYRDDRRAQITQLLAGVYRLPGSVPRDRVLAFYRTRMSQELAQRQQAVARSFLQSIRGTDAPALPAGPSPTPVPTVSSLAGGQGYLAISVDVDPARPRDTRVVVLRVEGSPAAQVHRLLSPLMGIVQDLYTTTTRSSEAATVQVDRSTPGAAPLTIPIFPNAIDLGGARLSEEQIPAAKQSISAGPYPVTVRRQVEQILSRARTVTLSRWRSPAPAKDVVTFYRQQLIARRVEPPLIDVTDPSGATLVYKLPQDAGLLMIRVYPDTAPSLALGGRLAPTGRVIISLLQIEGATDLPSAPAATPGAPAS
jgi:hypothetical protein